MHAGPIITRTRNYTLTGRVRFESVAFGLWRSRNVVGLEVEEQYEYVSYSAPRPDNLYNWQTVTRWRSAAPFDLSSPSLRWIIDGPKSAEAAA